ncbi:LytR C-terminal domain-containing protein [Herbiconiux sp. KACC 21604]|uniref:LytR C-terminal domain-containing protein n=1 Tax=unclassified Herbiconiux TaxID=2618217 RepID=UPI001492BFC6|nr:LytR C-terminal domain-containing protein [Herbiconiux sp. SALV-R1]QJU52533.1 LytR C-terminal domain-containing protein [Herbiconiux sp. SALV-R1]WPO87408.1 LytR C-terminal domain-containing protein [Herbiconiux sp. KACC 21604]
MAHFTQDSFDSLPAHPARVGAHRGPRPRGRGWVVLAWAALATVLLVGAGVVYLSVINNNIQFTDAFGGSSTSTDAPEAEPTEAAPAVTPITDGTLPVTILNGTEVVGLAGRVGESAVANGWNIATMANASTSDFATTTVYYEDPANEAAALGLAQLLGGVPTELSSSFQGAALTVVLGTDYAGPGAEAPVEEAPVDDGTGVEG